MFEDVQFGRGRRRLRLLESHLELAYQFEVLRTLVFAAEPAEELESCGEEFSIVNLSGEGLDCVESP